MTAIKTGNGLTANFVAFKNFMTCANKSELEINELKYKKECDHSRVSTLYPNKPSICLDCNEEL